MTRCISAPGEWARFNESSDRDGSHSKHQGDGDETIKHSQGFARHLGKTLVVSADRPGFVGYRIFVPTMMIEAFFALMEGVSSVEDIDVAMRPGTNQPMGPFTLADFIGLYVCLAVAQLMHKNLGEDKYRSCPLMVQYVQAGWLDRKSGRGVC